MLFDTTVSQAYAMQCEEEVSIEVHGQLLQNSQASKNTKTMTDSCYFLNWVESGES